MAIFLLTLFTKSWNGIIKKHFEICVFDFELSGRDNDPIFRESYNKINGFLGFIEEYLKLIFFEINIKRN